jgi:hypothetical protein
MSNNRSIRCCKTKPIPHATGVNFLTKLVKQRQTPALQSITQKNKLIICSIVLTVHLKEHRNDLRSVDSLAQVLLN